MPTLKELLNSARRIDARIAEQKAAAKANQSTATPAAEKSGKGNKGKDAELFSVHKITNGEAADRGSKYNLTQAQAEQFIADNPDNEYEIRPDTN